MLQKCERNSDPAHLGLLLFLLFKPFAFVVFKGQQVSGGLFKYLLAWAFPLAPLSEVDRCAKIGLGTNSRQCTWKAACAPSGASRFMALVLQVISGYASLILGCGMLLDGSLLTCWDVS